MPTRRAVLLGGAGATAVGMVGIGAGIEQGMLPGRPWLQQHVGLNGEDGVIPDIEAAPVLQESFTSAARGGLETGWSLIRPPGVGDGPLPLVVALHWLGADHRTLTGPQLGLDRYLAQHVHDGRRPFAIVAADGGRGYWHPHDDDDAGQMVISELLPRAVRSGHSLLPAAMGFLGWSMGGYGALRLAGIAGAGGASAVVASSPALWADAGDASGTGFSTAAEYEEYSVFDQQKTLNGMPVRVDVGTGDPFYRDVQQYADGFPSDAELTTTFEPGGHTPGYWRRMLPDQLAFLGKGFDAYF